MKAYLHIWKELQLKIKITYINGETHEGYLETYDDLGILTRERKSEENEICQNQPTMHPWATIQSITYIR